MNWPNDYLIPGLEPFYQEEAGIIYLALKWKTFCLFCLSIR